MVFHPFTFLPLACTCVGWQGICQWLNRSLEKEMVSGHPLGKEAAWSQWIRVTVDVHCPSEKSWCKHFTDHVSSCPSTKETHLPAHPPPTCFSSPVCSPLVSLGPRSPWGSASSRGTGCRQQMLILPISAEAKLFYVWQNPKAKKQKTKNYKHKWRPWTTFDFWTCKKYIDLIPLILIHTSILFFNYPFLPPQ